MSPKNIVICADGTGNKGGYSPDSNVYKVYKTIDTRSHLSSGDKSAGIEQIVFYDNGVGTATNKILRALGGSVGFGFGRNVCDLYKFIARNYNKGDSIYFFGFSRGASTVRACNGMIKKYGVVKGNGLQNSQLDACVDKVFSAYKNKLTTDEFKGKVKLDDDLNVDFNVDIKFLGVWDTVVALGFPKNTDASEPFTYVLKRLFSAVEKVADIIFPHNFYHYKLTDNVDYAYQALSIDDERTAFWPYVWQERCVEGEPGRERNTVEQVWFSGMHSNVGGGYERAGMAGVPLVWMMKRAQHHGLVFEDDALQNAINASHVHGRMYNSRDGLAIFYRYHPREIFKLCRYKNENGVDKTKLLDQIKIHESVIDRMKHRTANYAPGALPDKFDIVNDDIADASGANIVEKHAPEATGEAANKWKSIRERLDKTIESRKQLYGIFLGTVITIVICALYLWNAPLCDAGLERLENIDRIFSKGCLTDYTCVLGHVAIGLDYITPDMFDNLIYMAVVKMPLIFAATIALLLTYWAIKKRLTKKTVKVCEELRHEILNNLNKL